MRVAIAHAVPAVKHHGIMTISKDGKIWGLWLISPPSPNSQTMSHTLLSRLLREQTEDPLLMRSSIFTRDVAYSITNHSLTSSTVVTVSLTCPPYPLP